MQYNNLKGIREDKDLTQKDISKILNVSQNFLSTVGTGSIINLIIITIIALIFSIILNKLFKNFSSSDILDISEFLGGKILKFIIKKI